MARVQSSALPPTQHSGQREPPHFLFQPLPLSAARSLGHFIQRDLTRQSQQFAPGVGSTLFSHDPTTRGAIAVHPLGKVTSPLEDRRLRECYRQIGHRVPCSVSCVVRRACESVGRHVPLVYGVCLGSECSASCVLRSVAPPVSRRCPVHVSSSFRC